MRKPEVSRCFQYLNFGAASQPASQSVHYCALLQKESIKNNIRCGCVTAIIQMWWIKWELLARYFFFVCAVNQGYCIHKQENVCSVLELENGVCNMILHLSTHENNNRVKVVNYRFLSFYIPRLKATKQVLLTWIGIFSTLHCFLLSSVS